MTEKRECQIIIGTAPIYPHNITSPVAAEVRCVTHNYALAGTMNGNRCLIGRIEDLEAEVAALKKPA